MRALVTGGAGFIGSHIVEELLLQGISVRVLDNFSTGKRENLEAFDGDLEIIEGDLRDENTIKRVTQGVNWIFHLAAFISVPESMDDPETCFEINVNGTVKLLEAARTVGTSKVILSSSTAVYGDTDNFPTDEDTPLRPLSPYALSKQVNELYAHLYTHSYNLPVTALRYFNVFGPRQRPDSDYAAAISIFTRKLVNKEPVTIYGDGKQSRDFIFVKDVVRANILAARSDSAGDVFNICTGRETTILDLLEEFSELVPFQPKVIFEGARAGDIFRSQGNPAKAAAVLNFHAKTSLSLGLEKTIEWMKTK